MIAPVAFICKFASFGWKRSSILTHGWSALPLGIIGVMSVIDHDSHILGDLSVSPLGEYTAPGHKLRFFESYNSGFVTLSGSILCMRCGENPAQGLVAR